MDELDAEALARLPIFPLPGTVLFPDAVLPLHVFEPRYRDLVIHCLSSDRALAVPMLRPGFEADYEGRPPVYEVMGAGRIVSQERLPDGRWNILVYGWGRVRLISEHAPTAAFRTIRAERLPVVAASHPDLPAAEARLRALVRRVGEATPGGREPLARLLALLDTPASLADVVAANLLSDVDARQRILEELDLLRRMKLVIEAVGKLLLALTPGREGSGTVH